MENVVRGTGLDMFNIKWTLSIGLTRKKPVDGEEWVLNQVKEALKPSS